MFDSLKEKFRRFMAGRYGTDSFNQFLNILVLALLVINMIFKLRLFFYLAVAAWCYELYRMFSRNIPARTAENYKYYTLKNKASAYLRTRKARFAGMKQYRYYTCPKCRQKLRVPRGRGRIQISCPRCNTQFIKKS